ncbi:MAG: hypothetical protein ABWK53_13315 [Anaerolineales bacterium]
MNKDTQKWAIKQEHQKKSGELEKRCYEFLFGLLASLDANLNRRLVETFLAVVLAIIMHRNRPQGLLLSELGGYISNLLHSKGWSAEFIETYLWVQAERQVETWLAAGETVLVIWDESVVEKPESLQLEGLCAVRSSKAQRLKRIKPGFFNPPGGRPIFVPGYHWLQVLVAGMSGAPQIATFQWWTTRGPHATDKRSLEAQVLREVTDRWGSQVLHVWDRGFAGAPWLSLAYVHAVRFVLRWPKRYGLLDECGQERAAWQLTRGKRSWEYRLLWDARRRCYRKTGILAVRVYDKTYRQPLWLVVARPGAGREPWYLLTNEPIRTAQEAWQIVLAYARRWNIEMSIRFDKCELAFESPRLHQWETQRRLLLIATLAYAFLLSLLNFHDLLNWLLQFWCHRTGQWRLKVKAPLYRLRSALSRLWLTHPPPLIQRLTSG